MVSHGFWVCIYVVFFFFKQKTAYEVRISDWSSDVVSSDLVFAAMIARALDDRDGAGIAHREALAGTAGRVQIATGGAVQAGIAHDRGVARNITRAGRRAQHQPTAGHALADAIVGIADQFHAQAAGIEGAETLPGRTAQIHLHRRRLHAEVAPTPGDVARDAGTNGAVVIGDRVTHFGAAAIVDRAAQIIEQTLAQRAGIARTSEEHTSELQSLMRISYAVFCLKKTITKSTKHTSHSSTHFTPTYTTHTTTLTIH